MEKFCKDLREHSTKIINYEKKKIIILTPEENKGYDDQKVYYICKKEFDNNDNDKKVRDHCHYTGKYRGAAWRYKIPKETPVVFHNGSTYDYHFIIKEFVKEFKGNFECLGGNTEKYITFSVPIKRRIENKDMEITYKIKFIDSFRFIATSLSNLVDSLTKGIHNNKCLDCNSCLNYVRITKNEKLLLKCDIFYKKKFNKDLIKKFKNTYSFCNNDLNKFMLLIRKGVYTYQYMDSWEKFSKLHCQLKKIFIAT